MCPFCRSSSSILAQSRQRGLSREPAQTPAWGIEPLPGASDPLRDQLLVVSPELVPELVELRVVGAVDNVAELVEHGVEDFFEGEKDVVSVGTTEAELYVGAVVDVEAEKRLVGRTELGEELDLPFAAARDGLDLAGNALEETAGLVVVGLPL